MLTAKLKREGMAQVKTAGIEFDRAVFERLGGDGTVDIINFDGMGCLHHDLVRVLMQSAFVATPSVVAVNMLGGREAKLERVNMAFDRAVRNDADALPTMTSFGKRVNPNHALRVRTLVKRTFDSVSSLRCWAHVHSIAWDVYISSSKQPMVWCVLGIEPHSDHDQAWRHVEERWCIAPPCVYLKDPTSFRSLLDKRDRFLIEAMELKRTACEMTGDARKSSDDLAEMLIKQAAGMHADLIRMNHDLVDRSFGDMDESERELLLARMTSSIDPVMESVAEGIGGRY
jgi:hypothetical protein